MTDTAKTKAPRRKIAAAKVAAIAVSPITVSMLVADEFRQESSGKMFVVGLFPDGVVNLDIPLDVPPIGPDNPINIQRLCLMLVIKGAVGLLDFSVSIQVEPGQPAQLIVEDKVNFTQLDGSRNMILILEKFKTFSEGEKLVYVKIGNQHTSTHMFEMKRALKV